VTFLGVFCILPKRGSLAAQGAARDLFSTNKAKVHALKTPIQGVFLTGFRIHP